MAEGIGVDEVVVSRVMQVCVVRDVLECENCLSELLLSSYKLTFGAVNDGCDGPRRHCGLECPTSSGAAV